MITQMCEPIYVIQNITLWSCPINMACTITPSQKINFTIQNVSRIKTSLNSSTLVFNYTLNQNKTLALNTSVYVPTNVFLNESLPEEVPNQNNTLALNTSVYVPTNVFLNESLPEEDEVSPEPPEETPEPTNTQRVIVYLRHSNRSNSSNTNTTNKLNNCVCDTSQPWLHMFWIFPVLIVLSIFFLKWRNPKHRISNVFIPQQTKKLTRSQSWPKLSEVRPVNRVPAFPASEPGDISSRGVFLTGIL
mgnify:CR=1 FL=1